MNSSSKLGKYTWPLSIMGVNCMRLVHRIFFNTKYYSTTRPKVGSIQEFESMNTEKSWVQRNRTHGGPTINYTQTLTARVWCPTLIKSPLT